MKVFPVQLEQAAIADIEAIADYIVDAGGGFVAAQGFVGRIHEHCRKIGLMPFGGVSRPQLGLDIRLMPFERSAVILYRVHEDRVQIVNVFYGGRDYAALVDRDAD